MRAPTAALFLLAAVAPVSQSIKCQKCDTTAQGDCNSGTCDGVWCAATITENKATRSRLEHKDCASANPAGASKEDGCVKDTQADGTESYRCGCNSGDNCNSEAGIARMQSMLNNQFSLAGAGSAGAPFPGAGGQPPNGQLPQVPPSLVNPNSTFTDILAGQPTPSSGGNPNQPPQPVQPLQPGQIQPGLNPGVPPQPNASSPIGGQAPQFPPPTGNQPPFPQGGSNLSPPSPNQNKPIGARPGGRGESETGFGPLLGGSPPNSNAVDIHTAANSSDSNKVPSDNRPAPPTNDLSGNAPGAQDGRSRSGAINVKSGARTCACTEPTCNGPCKGEACYMMMFSANDVHNQAFAGKQGQIVQTGCTDDPTVLTEGVHHAHRQIPNYRFKVNGQEITVPASASYCNDGDYCNGAGILYAKSTAVVVGASLALAFLIKF